MTGQPPPPAPGLEHATEGLIVLHEESVDDVLVASRRRILLWDVAPREIQLARGAIEFDVKRRIAADAVVQVRLEDAGRRSRVSVELSSGEVVDLIGKRPLGEAKPTAELVAKVTGAELATA